MPLDPEHLLHLEAQRLAVLEQRASRARRPRCAARACARSPRCAIARRARRRRRRAATISSRASGLIRRAARRRGAAARSGAPRFRPSPSSMRSAESGQSVATWSGSALVDPRAASAPRPRARPRGSAPACPRCRRRPSRRRPASPRRPRAGAGRARGSRCSGRAGGRARDRRRVPSGCAKSRGSFFVARELVEVLHQVARGGGDALRRGACRAASGTPP